MHIINEYTGQEIIRDKNLEDSEIETGMWFSLNGKWIHIDTNDPRIMEPLINSKYFILDEALCTGKKRGRVVSIKGRIPLGSMTIGPPSNSSNMVNVI